jgi:hypothetical protein
MNGGDFQRQAGGGFGGLSGPVPRDLVILLAVVLATFSLRFFAATQSLHALLSLSSNTWRHAFLWQPLTYLFTGVGDPGIWFLLELLILFLFGRTVYYQLGRRGFWRFLLVVGVSSALLAVVVDLLATLGAGPSLHSFALMQGQHMLLTLTIAAFATMNRDATILLFFVLPVQARWFLLLEILFAFMGFLGTRDLAGFVGLSAGVGLSMLYLDWGPGGGAGTSGLRRPWLRLQEWWIKRRLKDMRRKRGLRLVDDERDGPPADDDWVH